MITVGLDSLGSVMHSLVYPVNTMTKQEQAVIEAARKYREARDKVLNYRGSDVTRRREDMLLAECALLKAAVTLNPKEGK